MQNKKRKIKINIKDEKKELLNLIKSIFSLDTFEFLLSIGLCFFIIIMGGWAIPQIEEHFRDWFALCVLSAACYVMIRALDEFGVFRDAKSTI